MPDTESFFDKIKDFIPVVAGAGIGALAGGGPGAMMGAGGVAQAEGAGEKEESARQEKLLQVMSMMEQRKATEAFQGGELGLRQQQIQATAHQNETLDDIKKQGLIYQHQDRQDAITARKDIADDEKATREMVLNMQKSNSPPTESEFNAWAQHLPADQQKEAAGWRGSPMMRAQFVQKIASGVAQNLPSVRNGQVDRIIKATGMDRDTVIRITDGMDGRRLKSTADSLEAGTLKANTPEALAKAGAKDAANDAKTRSALAKDLKTQFQAYGKQGFLSRWSGKPGDYVVNNISDAAFEGLTGAQALAARKQIQRYFNGGGKDIDQIARVIFPDDPVAFKKSPSATSAATTPGTPAANINPPFPGAERGSYKGRAGWLDRKGREFHPD